MRKTLFLLPFLTLLSACDQIGQKLGLEDPTKKEAQQEAEGKAVGSACRQSGRAIEDCYSIYSWLPKAAVFAGWREMDSYMRDNKIETVEPQLPPPEPPGKKKKKAAEAPAEEHKSKESGAEKGDEKASAKADSAPADKAEAATEKSAKH
ncbi:MAG: hypothetical protein KA603_01435 [Azonexus sp.]|nr:hypothetical protein [Betaproteobacteria bacterium]MBK8918850.1 hypothetical protein [Betaproteobacteria bacterium]MBP6034782.1 hypothetical protein [Azonexus sp.]MBP6905322.1 hypothetical protein [Azonexus sp.]